MNWLQKTSEESSLESSDYTTNYPIAGSVVGGLRVLDQMNYPKAKDLWVSSFIEPRLLKVFSRGFTLGRPVPRNI